jgi:hypothetical protein
MPAVVRRTLTVHVFTEVDERGQGKSIKWLAASMVGAPKLSNDPTVVVVVDEEGVELARSAFHASKDFQAYVDAQLMKPT